MTSDRRLQRYLRRTAARGRDAVAVGPFLALLHPSDPMRYLNYAVPDEGAEATSAHARALAEAMRARDRLPRLEYVESEAPALGAVLEQAGYACEARLDLMTCTPQSLRHPPLPPGAALERVDARSSAEDQRRLRATQRAAFGVDGEGDDAMGASTGMVVTLGAEPAAGGVYTAPDDGLSELAGIGTLEPFRRRGLAGALTAALAEAAFADGVEVAFLTPGDDDTRRVYERAGFSATSVVLAYAQEPGG